MARTGWNPATVYSLDITNPRWAVSVPGSLNLVRIESFKERSGTWQDTVCRASVTTGPYAIVTAIASRAKSLRELVKRAPERLRDQAWKNEALKSPWLYATDSGRGQGRVLAVHSSRAPSSASGWWKNQIIAHNTATQAFNARAEIENAKILLESAREGSEACIKEEAIEAARVNPQENQRSKRDKDALTTVVVDAKPRSTIALRSYIPEDMTTTDWRDIYAGFIFVDSNYSWLLTQWALGHRRLTSTRHYLRSRLWRSFSERRLIDAQKAIFSQIENGELDAVTLRVQLDFGRHPSKKELARLKAYRDALKGQQLTVSGYHCFTPFLPPKEMDPTNPRDGKTLARCGDRCPNCPYAFAVDPDYLVKTLVNLRLVRRGMSASAWDASQFASQTEMLENDLKQWSEDELLPYIEKWELFFRARGDNPFAWAGLN